MNPVLENGEVLQGEGCGEARDSYRGALPYLELLHSRHVRPHLGWEIGAAVYLLLPSMAHRSVEEPDYGVEWWTESDFWLAPNAFLFFGLTI